MKSFARLLCIIIAVVLLYLSPLQYLYDNHNSVMHSHILQETTDFVEVVRGEGHLTIKMYENFLTEISRAGGPYTVEMEIAKPVIGSIDITENTLKQETVNLSLKKNNINTMALASHTHTDACYNGMKHTHSAYGGSCYTYYNDEEWVSHSHSSSCYDTQLGEPCGGSITASTSSTTCSIDGNSGTYYSYSCDRCGASNGYAITYSGCNHGIRAGGGGTCSSRSSTTVLTCNLGSGYWEGSSGYNFTCKLTAGTYYNGTTVVSATCHQVVVSIAATKTSQTVIQGNAIVSTVTATYLDGHTAVINCSHNYNGQIGTQTVTLTYSGLVGNAKTTGTRTATTTVVTQPNKKPASLTVTPSSSTVYNGMEPTYTVRVNYDNGTNQIITTGYTKTGFTTGPGTKSVTFTYTENGITVRATITITVKRNIKTCPYGHVYELDERDVDHGCPTCKTLVTAINVTPKTVTIKLGEPLQNKITVVATYLDGTSARITNWTSNFKSNRVGVQLVEIKYGNLKTLITVEVESKITCSVCGTVYDAAEDGSNPGCPNCKAEIVSITANPNNIVVELGADFITTVTAHFRNGSKKEITEWTSNFDPYKEGTQNVTIFYQSFKTEIKVTVRGDLIVCPICETEYSWKENPLGCPVCSKTIVGIEAYLKSGGDKVPYGSELSLTVIVTFKDNHKELAMKGWVIENYDPTLLGEQTVLVRYQGFSTSLTVIVINNMEKVVCENGHVYYLNEDGSDPGCPYCLTGTEHRAVEYENILFTGEILRHLEEESRIDFDKGDYITVKVYKNSVKEGASQFFSIGQEPFMVVYGGKITNEFRTIRKDN